MFLDDFMIKMLVVLILFRWDFFILIEGIIFGSKILIYPLIKFKYNLLYGDE